MSHAQFHNHVNELIGHGVPWPEAIRIVASSQADTEKGGSK